MGGGETGGKVEFRKSRADREGVLEPFADDEIATRGAGPEADGMPVQMSKDPFRALDRSQTAGGRVEKNPCASGDLAPIVSDLSQQGRGPLWRIGVVFALPQEDPRVIAQGRAKTCLLYTSPSPRD